MDIVLSLAANGELTSSIQPIWVTADAQALDDRAARLIANGSLTEKPTWRIIENTQAAIESALLRLASDDPTESAHTADFLVIDVPATNPVQAGVIDVANAAMVAEQLALAHQLAIENKIAAIVTGPLQKSALIEADIRLDDGTMFSGHTEYFMQKSGCDKVVMMLANDAMKVALVTTHLPLRDVPAAITKANVQQTVHIVLEDLRSKFGLTQPKVLVCGLNPHAGEGGHLGMEEIEIINPVLDTFRVQGVDISEAMPADTLFTPRHLADCDAVIAMYHDQGLPVLKSHGFGDTVNLTLGLPYIRTSVDHGTALDLAGTGKASASSLKQALTMAQSMAASR
jgi:4-hydroxythreonine-4-phosphate dehydrogenase